jgi:hypothetical protein
MESNVVALEPFVDAEVVAKHVGKHRKTVLKLARLGIIPDYCDRTAKRKHRSFKLSEVDAALKSRYAPAATRAAH